MRKNKAKKKAFKWWVEFCEGERTVFVYPTESDMIWSLKENGPQFVGEVEVPERTHKRLVKTFKDPNVAFATLRWNSYAPKFAGMDRI